MDRNFIAQFVPTQSPLNGLYENISLIGGTGGDGAFSVIFQAREIKDGRDVALKFFVDGSDPYRRACFDREGTLLSGLFKGEALFVQSIQGQERLVFSATTPQSVRFPVELPYIALEWLPRGNVGRFCAPPTAGAQVARRLGIFRRMCRCVSRMHFLGCGHRDLKPENFMLGLKDAVKVIDFGTAKLIVPGQPSLAQQYSGPVGDLRYAAPEALAGLTPDLEMARRADVYALGAILFEMLTGQHLYLHTLRNIPELHQFVVSMNAIPENQRAKVLLGFLSSAKWAVPRVRSINPDIPRCVHHQLDELIQELTRLDFRHRVSALQRVHPMTRICELLLIQEERRQARKARRETSQGAVANV